MFGDKGGRNFKSCRAKEIRITEVLKARQEYTKVIELGMPEVRRIGQIHLGDQTPPEQ